MSAQWTSNMSWSKWMNYINVVTFMTDCDSCIQSDSSLVVNGAQGKDEIPKRRFQEFPLLPLRLFTSAAAGLGSRWQDLNYPNSSPFLEFRFFIPISFHFHSHFLPIEFVRIPIASSQTLIFLQLYAKEAGGGKPSHCDLENPFSTPHFFPRCNFPCLSANFNSHLNSHDVSKFPLLPLRQ